MHPDPTTPDRYWFECEQCGHREVSTSHVEVCAECGGLVRNISVPRE